MDLPPAPTCHRLPQLATRGISFNFHVFLGFLFFFYSVLCLPCRCFFFFVFFWMCCCDSFIRCSPLATLCFPRGIINIYAWIGDNKHADIPSILYLYSPLPPFPFVCLLASPFCLVPFGPFVWQLPSKWITNIGNTLANGILFDALTQIW